MAPGVCIWTTMQWMCVYTSLPSFRGQRRIPMDVMASVAVLSVAQRDQLRTVLRESLRAWATCYRKKEAAFASVSTRNLIFCLLECLCTGQAAPIMLTTRRFCPKVCTRTHDRVLIAGSGLLQLKAKCKKYAPPLQSGCLQRDKHVTIALNVAHERCSCT
jgi:hypothetical protein